MHKRNTNVTGFTIVELLIVIVVIAILAAISIVAFTGIQNRAYDSNVESDIQAIITKLELVKVDLGHYPHSAVEFPDGFRFSKDAYDTSINNVYYAVDFATDRYAMGLRSRSGRGYIIDTGTVTKGVNGIGGVMTANVIGLSWGSTSTSYTTQGYLSGKGPPSYTDGWVNGWAWTSG